ncbi:NACHT domain-containing protein [Pedobacter nyackensis]|uniref:NACHT domain-containing protein n=1 Tax=Pedobacter nyackensis TaxID=475255 RepID=UPI00292E8CB0|nr:NACHT domain-containing protein [Pedobacter nyackensis]
MDEVSILNELKGLILIKTGIRTITPADCKRISIEISRTLNKNVSETTIKRLFGFAVVKHNFSKFTITTLSEYVNGENLENWPSAVSHISNVPATWNDVKYKVAKITDFTLKGIKNRSGMPYQMTISRKFAEHDFDEFFKSDYSFTAFISQPGYGKTILLSHVVEKFFNSASPIYKDSSVLFLQAYSFFNTENILLNFEDQLKALLNIPKKDSLLNYIEENYQQTKGKFVIFLDGFSELTLKKELKKQLFESIINFICAIEHLDSIKLVLSMRSTNWTRFYDLIRHSAYLRTKWFTGNYFNHTEISNVPPLTEKEVDQIISNIGGENVKEINPKLKAQLKFPFHIQLYHQLKEEDPTFNYSTNITFHELISRFIQENIYRSNYYTEKILFLKKIIQLTNYGKDGTSVPKDSLIGELAAFKNAYMELLSDGIIMEEKRYENYHPREFVRFIHSHIFEYFLFIELLEIFHLQVDQKFFQHVQTQYENESIRFQLIQWALRFIIRIGDLKALFSIFDLPLNQKEHNYLILFIAENLKYRSRYSADTTLLLKECNIHDKIIEEMMHFDFVDSSYKEAIEVMSDISDSNEHQVIYQSLLAILDMLSLDEEKINVRMQSIRALDCSDWELNPYEVIKLVYSKLTNTPTENPLFLAQIEHFQYPFLGREKALNTKQGIIYLLTIVLNLFYGSDEDTIKIIDLIIKSHPQEFKKRSAFTILFMNILALSKSRIKPGKKTDQLIKILVHIHENKNRFKATQNAESILKMTQAYQLRNKGEYLLASEYCDDCIHLFKRNHLNLNCILIYNLVISLYADLNDIVKVNEYKYERLCFMDDHNIPARIFALPTEFTDFKNR